MHRSRERPAVQERQRLAHPLGLEQRERGGTDVLGERSGSMSKPPTLRARAAGLGSTAAGSARSHRISPIAAAAAAAAPATQNRTLIDCARKPKNPAAHDGVFAGGACDCLQRSSRDFCRPAKFGSPATFATASRISSWLKGPSAGAALEAAGVSAVDAAVGAAAAQRRRS